MLLPFAIVVRYIDSSPFERREKEQGEDEHEVIEPLRMCVMPGTM